MPRHAARRKIAIVTGSRAEFGLLTPVIRAIGAHPRLEAHVIAAGSHFLGPARTIRDVEALFPVAGKVRMQKAGHSTRADDARAVARGIDGFSRAFAELQPGWVVVLGDRIEAFAAASAAAIAGIGVAHIHGGDRAEGIADESMRHAITKLAHLHLAATKQSGERIIRMGERAEHVHVVGSPAIDGLAGIRTTTDEQVRRLILPRDWTHPHLVVLLHPSGIEGGEGAWFDEQVFRGAVVMAGPRVLTFAPNFDAGRERIERLRRLYAKDHGWASVEHLPRDQWISLLKWMARKRVPLMGNSSAGLIEAAALGVCAINVGPRQAGRERDRNVIDVPDPAVEMIPLVEKVRRRTRRLGPSRLYGDGRSGPRIARLLAGVNPRDPALLRKQITY